MSPNLLENIVEKRPELLERIVFFCTKGKSNLPCVLKANGTVSPICAIEKEYSTSASLVQDLLNGVIWTDGFSIGRRKTALKLQFANDLYMCKNRTVLLRSLINDPTPLEHQMQMDVGQCAGFKIRNTPLAAIRMLQIPELLVFAGGNIRNSQCSIDISNDAPASVCNICCELRKRIYKRLSKLRREKRFCTGSDELLDQRQAGSDKTLETHSRPLLSCCGIISTPKKRKCRNCRSNRRLKIRRKSRTADVEKRILFTPNKYLSRYGGREKLALICRNQRRRIQKLKRKTARMVTRKEKEVDKFKPENPADQRAVASLTKQFNKESAKLVNTTCQWKIGDGHCEVQLAGRNELEHHVTSVHIRNQFKEIQRLQLKPCERKYYCHWDGCRRKAPFQKRYLLVHHVQEHVGSSKTSSRLNALRDQATNLGRAPTGRRWSKQSKELALENYQSRRAWKATLAASALPLPSISTVLKEKNVGGIKPGIDHLIMEKLARICKVKPEYGMGILVFDEVYIRPGIDFNNADDAFGYAENGNVEKGELANAVLVFQYMAIFAPGKFRLNIAWYPVRRCDNHWLKTWLLQTMCALYFNGITITALVCDGSSVNRNLQKSLLNGITNRGDGSFCYPPSSTNRVYVLSDPSHCLKKLRNNWLLGRLWRSESKIDWWYVHRAYEWQKGAYVDRIDRPLTEKHLCIDKSSRMCVRTAVDVFSEPIEDLIYRELGDRNDSAETRLFMKYCRDFWLAVNSKRRFSSIDAAKTTIFDPLSGVLDYFVEWKAQVTRNRFLTRETYDDLRNICEGLPAFINYLLTCVVPGTNWKVQVNKVTQDYLERDFGILRMKAGGTRNPTLKSVAYNLRSLNMRRLGRLENTLIVSTEE